MYFCVFSEGAAVAGAGEWEDVSSGGGAETSGDDAGKWKLPLETWTSTGRI